MNRPPHVTDKIDLEEGASMSSMDSPFGHSDPSLLIKELRQRAEELGEQTAVGSVLAQAADHVQRSQVADLLDHLDTAWGVIANAGGGDWSREHPEWVEAAKRWRDRWDEILRAQPCVCGDRAGAPTGTVHRTDGPCYVYEGERDGLEGNHGGVEAVTS